MIDYSYHLRLISSFFLIFSFQHLTCYALLQIACNSESDVAYDESQEAVSGSDDNSTSGESIHVLQYIRGMIKN